MITIADIKDGLGFFNDPVKTMQWRLKRTIVDLSDMEKVRMTAAQCQIHFHDVVDSVLANGGIFRLQDRETGEWHQSLTFTEGDKKFLTELLASMAQREVLRVYRRRSRHSSAFYEYKRLEGPFYLESERDEWLEENPGGVYFYPGIREAARKKVCMNDGEVYQCLFNDVARQLTNPTPT